MIVVAGIGSEHRRDDGAGPRVAALASEEAGVTDLGPLGDPLDLLGQWDGAALAVVVDAVRSGAAPGTVRLVELAAAAPQGPARPAAPAAATSTHGIGLDGVLRLAAELGRAPRRVVVVGIEGEDFGRGVGFSPAVAAAVPRAVAMVRALVEEARTCA